MTTFNEAIAAAKTLADTKIGSKPIHVRHVKTGEEGWVAQYGKTDFGGIRQSIFRTEKDAGEACVSDDVGPKMVRRGWILDLPQWRIV
tara:strand:+ start:1454 stop:1717 length:264 start_codon:yes stop_codon:yes gene_type:complete